jgi:hypothetical protein
MFHPYEYAGPLRIPPPKMQVRVRREVNTHDAVNTRLVESWQAAVPVPQGEFIQMRGGKIYTGREAILPPEAYDMAPLTSRTDKRDYRQSQPFQVNGPSLAMNPYFDRYDPTRDPRNAIRELRGVVYEDKEADRGLEESKRLLARGYMTRWMPEGSSEEDLQASLQAYEVMRPKMDDWGRNYRPAEESGQVGLPRAPLTIKKEDSTQPSGVRTSPLQVPYIVG